MKKQIPSIAEYATASPTVVKSLSNRLIPWDAVLVFGCFLVICVIELLSILEINNGKFVYPLDDAYIHLAVAEEIARGHYGVNQSEFSAPSSSIIWPLFLVPFARTPLSEFWPLILNFGFGLLTCWVVIRGVRQFFPAGAPKSELNLTIARVAVSGLILMGCNLPCIIFLGMEHSLQILLSILVVDGIIRSVKNEKIDSLFILAAISGPLVRYENLALTLSACVVLFYARHYRLAWIVIVTAIAGLLLFSLVLLSLGLSMMPSSIQVKSQFIGGEGLFASLFIAIETSLTINRGVFILSMILCLVWLAVRPNSEKTRPAVLGLIVAGVLHVCFGQFGWYNRYECYIYGALLYGIFGVTVGSYVRIAKRWTRAASMLVVLVNGLVSFPYITSWFTLPIASNNIYEQQFQMHRFVTEWWKRPVAVNDLGWVAFQNEQYVLDLWGLGSQVILEARKEGKQAECIAAMVKQHNVELAIVYDGVAPNEKLGWVKVGELHLSRRQITPLYSKVVFFATRPESSSEINSLLADFRKTLPPGAMLITRSHEKL